MNLEHAHERGPRTVHPAPHVIALHADGDEVAGRKKCLVRQWCPLAIVWKLAQGSGLKAQARAFSS